MLDGPNAFEKSIGMGTEIPAGSALHSLTIADGIAMADLSSVSPIRRWEPVDAAAHCRTRVHGVYTVPDRTECHDPHRRQDRGRHRWRRRSGIGSCTAADFTDQTPLILVESPVPGQSVTSPLEVAGISNTFEATVNYSVNDPDGLGSVEWARRWHRPGRTWATSSTSSSTSGHRSAMGRLGDHVEVSPKDGSLVQDVDEVPGQHALRRPDPSERPQPVPPWRRCRRRNRHRPSSTNGRDPASLSGVVVSVRVGATRPASMWMMRSAAAAT